MEQGSRKSSPSALSQINRRKSTGEEEVFTIFFLHTRGGKMDLLIWLCGCILAFLLPSGAKTEEVGKFDTFAARLDVS